MIVFYEVSTGQVMAVYSHDTLTTTWTDQGFVRADVPESLQPGMSRDHTVTVNRGAVTAKVANTNPVQPAAVVTIGEKREKAIEALLIEQGARADAPVEVRDYRTARGA